MCCRKGVIRNFPKFTERHLCQSLLLKRLWHRCFPVNFGKFVRTPFLTEYLWWLLLAHFGIFNTIRRVYNNYWWPTVKEYVTNFISAGKICLSIKTPKRPCGKMGRRKWPIATLELISLDFLVDLPRTNKGNVHSNQRSFY